jgi:UDP-N-acetylmuramate dehydrogenase
MKTTGAAVTTMRIGGEIENWVSPTTSELPSVLAGTDPTQLRVVGGGSNLVLSDAGLRGTVLHLKGVGTQVWSDERVSQDLPALVRVSGLSAPYQTGGEASMLQLSDGQQLAAQLAVIPERVVLVLDAGMPWGQAVATSLQRKLGGLHWYARIPCQVGGAVYNNIHAEQHLLSEVVQAVEAFDLASQTLRWYAASELEFGYDTSYFHYHPAVITRVAFALIPLTDELHHACRSSYTQWTQAKAVAQPAGANCGSVFQNLTLEQKQSANLPQLAAGWYLDQVGAKQEGRGELQVSQVHANFISNQGVGSQADFIDLVELLRGRVYEQFGFWLHPEVECWDEYGKVLPWRTAS